MPSIIVKTLMENGNEKFKEISGVLIQIAEKILQNPSIEKYRSVRISSKVFQNLLLPYNGAMQCLLEMGFSENDDRFTFFDDSKLENLKNIYEELTAYNNLANISPELAKSHKNIYSRLQVHFLHSRIYEDAKVHEKASTVIPAENLKKQAQARFIRKKKNDPNSCYTHYLILELLTWFKKSFFTWMDSPKCVDCENPPKPTSCGMLPPTDDEVFWGASRVEGFLCDSCKRILRFPRFNNPVKLLQTRTGRCGEWANCFTLMCRVMGFEARHVLDFTDHVWTEVYIPEWRRWVHCDPCENVCDTPLMYEQGWKKELSLIVAASAEEIVDVTWRYSINRDSTKAIRRTLFNEAWLADTIDLFNASLPIVSSSERLNELKIRREKEIREFEQIKKVTEDELAGRSSGSLEWRLARGETHGNDAVEKMIESEIIEFTNEEIANCLFHLEYSSSTDEYKRASNNHETVMGWESLMRRSRAMMRKEEFDWHMAYLCRTPNSNEGYISWKVQIPPSYVVVDVEVNFKCDRFESGVVSALLCSDRTCEVIRPGHGSKFSTTFAESRVISIHSFLRGGSGENAWQKSQLFRESTVESSPSPTFLLRIKIAKQA